MLVMKEYYYSTHIIVNFVATVCLLARFKMNYQIPLPEGTIFFLHSVKYVVSRHTSVIKTNY